MKRSTPAPPARPTRTKRRATPAAKAIARRYGVPLSVATRAVAHVNRGRATPEFEREVEQLHGREPLPAFPPLDALLVPRPKATASSSCPRIATHDRI